MFGFCVLGGAGWNAVAENLGIDYEAVISEQKWDAMCLQSTAREIWASSVTIRDFGWLCTGDWRILPRRDCK